MAKTKKKKRSRWVTVAKWSALVIVARELYLSLGPRRQKRRDRFNEAQYRAQQTGKPLVVVGDPDAGIVNRFVGRDYGCATLCIDRHGCLACENQKIGRLEEVLPTMESDSAVVFVSATLEYVDDMDKVAAELYRVSGGDLFVVTVEPWTMTSILYPGGKRQFFEAPPRDPRLRWKDHYWAQKRSPTPQFPLTTMGIGRLESPR